MNLERIGEVTDTRDGFEWRFQVSSLRDNILYRSPYFFYAQREWLIWMNVISLAMERSGLFYIDLMLETRRPCHAEFTFSLKSVDGARHSEENRTGVLERRKRESDWFPLYLNERLMSDCEKEDALTVLCEIRLIDPAAGASQSNVQLREQSEVMQLKRLNEELTRKVAGLQRLLTSATERESALRRTRLHEDLRRLFLEQEDCDVLVRVRGREFRAHSPILRARSPVFASTFRSDMRERATGTIDIEDLDPTTFPDFLRYLYCAEVDNLSVQNVFGLYTAADKYQVADLKAMCVTYMKENLSIEIFCDVIRLALLHSEIQLVDFCTIFFVKNATNIITTVGWQTFNAENPMQANELFIKFDTSVQHSNK